MSADRLIARTALEHSAAVAQFRAVAAVPHDIQDADCEPDTISTFFFFFATCTSEKPATRAQAARAPLRRVCSAASARGDVAGRPSSTSLDAKFDARKSFCGAGSAEGCKASERKVKCGRRKVKSWALCEKQKRSMANQRKNEAMKRKKRRNVHRSAAAEKFGSEVFGEGVDSVE